jgi:hypothetical protein
MTLKVHINDGALFQTTLTNKEIYYEDHPNLVTYCNLSNKPFPQSFTLNN